MGKVLTTDQNENLNWEQMQVLEEKGSADPSIISRDLSSASELHLSLLKMKTKPLMGLETPELRTQEGFKLLILGLTTWA